MNEPRHGQSIIDKLTTWAQRHPAVRVMLLTSTRARPQATIDRLSDFDVILVLTDIHPFVETKTWLQDFGEVLVAYWDPIYLDAVYGIEQSGNVTQYRDGLKIDFTLWPVALLHKILGEPALPAELDAGYRILLDKDQLTESMPAPTYAAYIPVRPTAEKFQTLINDFFSDAPYVAKCLWRDELLPAKWCLDHDMKHNYLRPLLEWYVAFQQNWSVPVGALGKELKKQLPPAIWSQLEKTYAAADIGDNWRALMQTLALFRQIGLEVAAGLGYAYPLELDERVTAYVHSIKHLSR